MATLTQVRTFVNEEYQKYFRIIYSDGNVSPCQIHFEEGEVYSTFNCSTHVMQIVLPDGDILDADKIRGFGLPRWKGDLIHEMIHEYVCNISFEPTEEGIALHRRHPNFFQGPGHDDRFFTAICIVYNYLINDLNLTLARFMEELRSGY